jgi:hypothetical protein
MADAATDGLVRGKSRIAVSGERNGLVWRVTGQLVLKQYVKHCASMAGTEHYTVAASLSDSRQPSGFASSEGPGGAAEVEMQSRDGSESITSRRVLDLLEAGRGRKRLAPEQESCRYSL